MTGGIVLACDVYGTFLNTSAVATVLQKNLGILDSITSTKAKEIAQEWRKYQLEYTWRLNSMGKYEPFDVVTRKSLLHALSDAGSSLSSDGIDQVMAFYHALPSFDDAAPAWHDLNAIQGVECWILSNGTREMVTAGLRASSLEVPKSILIAPDVQCYKPSAVIYQALVNKAGKEGSPEDVYLLSSNPFDIVGARLFGLNAIWVDRSGVGWKDQLGQGLGPGGREIGPTKVVRALDEVAEYVRSLSGAT